MRPAWKERYVSLCDYDVTPGLTFYGRKCRYTLPAEHKGKAAQHDLYALCRLAHDAKPLDGRHASRVAFAGHNLFLDESTDSTEGHGPIVRSSCHLPFQTFASQNSAKQPKP